MYHPAADSGKSAQGGGNIHLFDDLLSKHESANGQFFEEDSQAGQDPDGVNEVLCSLLYYACLASSMCDTMYAHTECFLFQYVSLHTCTLI